MSKLVAFAAIQGGYKVVSTVEGEYRKALETFNADTKVQFPNTGYYLPVIYSLLGMKVETLEDMKKPLEFARKLLPPHVKSKHHLPYLGPLLDAGMAALIAFEIAEGLRVVRQPDFYFPQIGLHLGGVHLLRINYKLRGHSPLFGHRKILSLFKPDQQHSCPATDQAGSVARITRIFQSVS